MNRDAQPARYCSRPFPAYRFRPGLPHPTRDPAGHSFEPPGSPHPPLPPPLVDGRWRESEAFLYGVDLYNHGFWWEAHEAWEGLWLGAGEGPEKGALQGFIQVAAMHLRIEAGEREGVERLLNRARANLAGVLAAGTAPFAGIQLAAWWSGVEAYQRACLSTANVRHQEDGFPYLRPA